MIFNVWLGLSVEDIRLVFLIVVYCVGVWVVDNEGFVFYVLRIFIVY